jgi:hypothetical protein
MTGGGGRKSMQHHRLAPMPVARSRDSAWCWLVIVAGFATVLFVVWPR